MQMLAHLLSGQFSCLYKTDSRKATEYFRCIEKIVEGFSGDIKMVLIAKQFYHESLARITFFEEERIMTSINLVCLLQVLLILVLFVKKCTS